MLLPMIPILPVSGVVHDSSGCSLLRRVEKIGVVISFGGREIVQEKF
jgi:hypothetical protein